MLDDLKINDNVQDTEKDTLPSSWSPLDSDVYLMHIDLVYTNKTPSGARAVHFEMHDAELQYPFKHTLYVTSGDAKGNRNTFTNSDGVEQLLPGMATAEAIAQLALGKSIGDLPTEEIVVDVWNREAGAKVSTKVQAFTDLHGKELYMGIRKVIDNKSVKGDDGRYHPTNDTIEFNEIEKVFNRDGLTRTELKAGATEPKFIKDWKDKFAGNTRNKFKEVANAPKAGAPAATSPAPQTKPLFS